MEEEKSKKSWIISLILCFFLGIFGIHNFYLKKIKKGIIQMITLGGLGIWALVDLFCIIQQKYKDKDGNIILKKESQNKVLKIVIVFMIVSIGCGIVYSSKKLIYSVNVFTNINNDFEKKYENISKIEPGMQVFLDNDATQEQIDRIGKTIRLIDGVSSIEFVSKQQALEKMKTNFEDNQWIFDEYEGENNIFPASFIVKIKNQSEYEKVYEQISKLKNIERISSNEQTTDTMDMIDEKKNVLFIFLIILIIDIIINILCEIVAVLFIFKQGLLKN